MPNALVPNRSAALRHIACVVAPLALASCMTLPMNQVSAVRIERAPDHTRLVLESPAPIRFSLWSVTSPLRVVLDLEGVALNETLNRLEARISTDHPYIASVQARKSATAGATLELILKTEAAPRIFTLPPQDGHDHRLVVGIYPFQPNGAVPQPPTLAGSKPDSVTEAPVPEEVWLAARINRQPRGVELLLRHQGRLLARGEDLRRWRLQLPDVEPLSHRGEAYYPLDALEDLSYHIDPADQMLIMDAPPLLFDETLLTGATAEFSEPTRGPPGGFLNYDLFSNRTDGRTQTSGRLELGAFGRWGVGTSSFLGRDSTGDAFPRDSGLVRLNTTWTHDRPEDLASLRLGDTISRPGSWGRSVRFGGLQWATKFATRPGFVTFPQPGLTGEAALPSTIDLYINDALRQRRQVPTGPFSIRDLPVITGQGEIRLVVRDLLGRERVITQPYYASPRLLREGLHDYSYELGFVRENFGVASNDYGRMLGAATHRLGFTDWATGEFHGEVLEDQQTLGLSGAFLWPAVGVFSTSLAGSRSDRGEGGLFGLGFQRQSRWLNFGANVELTSDGFAQLGLQPGQPAPRRIGRAFVSLATGGYGSFGVTYTDQAYRDREAVELASASYNANLGRFGALGLSVLHFLSGERETVASLTFTLSLGRRTTASLRGTTQSGRQEALLQVQRNLPAGSGFGYRLLAGLGDSDRRQAGISAQNDVGTYALEVARSRGQTGVRGSASGGVALLGGELFPSRRITGSFAVIQVADYPDVRVYADNQVVATTDADGNALLPRLRAYEQNTIRIEQSDLPLAVQIDTLRIEAVPYFRSGLLLEFPVTPSRGALLAIVLENGEPLPAGARVRILGQDGTFPVALRGEVYLTGLAPDNQLRATWRGQTCEFALPFPATDEPLPHLGTYVCTGITKGD